jgi:hypothetical protein
MLVGESASGKERYVVVFDGKYGQSFAMDLNGNLLFGIVIKDGVMDSARAKKLSGRCTLNEANKYFHCVARVTPDSYYVVSFEGN